MAAVGRLIAHAMAGFDYFWVWTEDYTYYRVTPIASRLLVYEFYDDGLPVLLKELKLDMLDFDGEVLTCPDEEEFYLRDPTSPGEPPVSPLHDSVSFFDTNYPVMLTNVHGEQRLILTVARCKVQYDSENYEALTLKLEEYAGLISLSVEDLVSDDPSVVIMDTVKYSGLHPPAFSEDFSYCHSVNVAPVTLVPKQWTDEV